MRAQEETSHDEGGIHRANRSSDKETLTLNHCNFTFELLYIFPSVNILELYMRDAGSSRDFLGWADDLRCRFLS